MRYRLRLPALIVAYAAIALACIAVRPLWLDEVLELGGTTLPSAGAMLRWIPENPGAAPLGYFIQRPFVQAFGPSAWWARFPALMFSVLCCVVLPRVCRELRLSRSNQWMALGIFMVLPSQFRYATEARVYSQALFFSLLSMLFLLQWIQRPAVWRAVIFAAAAAAAIQTHTYAVAGTSGMVLWAALRQVRSNQWKHAATIVVALFAAILTFLPWYRFAAPTWSASIQDYGYPPFHWTFALAQDWWKGISGGSVICSAALAALAAAGFFLTRPTDGFHGLLMANVLFSLVGPLIGDSLKDYFFAARQILFALPSLAILAALGVETVALRSRPAAAVAVSVLGIASLKNDVSFQMNAREDWPKAAQALARATGNGYCIELVEPRIRLYDVFVPGLAGNKCDFTAPLPSRAALVSHVYTSKKDIEAARQRLHALGFTASETFSVGGTTVTLEHR